MKPYLHFDYDNTLAHSMYASDEGHADYFLKIYGQYFEGEKYFISESDGWNYKDYWYVSFIRPWAKEIVDYFQMTMGRENVGILSWGTSEYVTKSMSVLGISMPLSNVYAREDIDANCPRFRGRNNILVDNMSYQEHLEAEKYNKVKFLHYLPKNKFVEVMDFDVRFTKEETDEKIENVIKNIKQSFWSKTSV